MGIDLHGLRFLQYAATREPFGKVATLGRQCIHLDSALQRKLLSPSPERPYGPYCEELLRERLGATSVTSFDASSYESATVIHDMNKPLQMNQQFDTVLDCGTLEHVFNVPIALSNIAALCKKGGRIIHALPGNNYSGHGFYQFSPELFFSVYSAANGFAETEVFIAEVTDGEHWWKSVVPVGGVRVEYTSSQRSYVLALSRKMDEQTRQSVQQSDYVANWQGVEINPTPKRRSAREGVRLMLENAPIFWRLAKAVNTHEDARYHRLSSANPSFRKVRIVDLLQHG